VVAFDAAVNQGPTFARSMVGSTQGDIEKMLEARQQRYNEVIKNNPSKRRFKAGWDNRMNAVRNYAMEDYHAKGGKVSVDDMKIALLRNK
jgi:ABC-type proline/glycine betaine transport system substrate-binding protein